MRFEPHQTLRGLEALGCFDITPRRVAAAKRAIAKKRTRDPLFADTLAVTDEEALERIVFYQEAQRRQLSENRRWQAEKWLLLRRIRRHVPWPVRVEFDAKWRSHRVSLPRRPEYGLDLMRAVLCGYYGMGRYKFSECTFVQDGEVVG